MVDLGLDSPSDLELHGSTDQLDPRISLSSSLSFGQTASHVPALLLDSPRVMAVRHLRGLSAFLAHAALSSVAVSTAGVEMACSPVSMSSTGRRSMTCASASGRPSIGCLGHCADALY